MRIISSVVLVLLAYAAGCTAFSGSSFKKLPNCYKSNLNRPFAKSELNMRWGLKGNQPAPSTTPDGTPLRDTVPFEIRGFSLPLVVFSIGIALTLGSFAGFFLNEGDSEGALSGLGFVYGIPVFLIGLSLWYFGE